EEKSMVRGRAFALSALTGAACVAWLSLLAACAPVPTPHGADAVPAAVTTDAFVTPDGLRLPLRRWTAEEPKAILIALHGMSDYSRAFTMPGPWLAERGITVLAYDQRSFGAGPKRG